MRFIKTFFLALCACSICAQVPTLQPDTTLSGEYLFYRTCINDDTDLIVYIPGEIPTLPSALAERCLPPGSIYISAISHKLSDAHSGYACVTSGVPEKIHWWNLMKKFPDNETARQYLPVGYLYLLSEPKPSLPAGAIFQVR